MARQCLARVAMLGGNELAQLNKRHFRSRLGHAQVLHPGQGEEIDGGSLDGLLGIRRPGHWVYVEMTEGRYRIGLSAAAYPAA